jgi:hypothetical protein
MISSVSYRRTKRASVGQSTLLPQSNAGRGVLFLLSIAAIAFAGIFLYALAMCPAGQTWGERLVRLGLGEFFAALFITGWTGMMWAVAAPSWLPKLARRVNRWMAFCLLIPFVIMLGLAVCAW